MLRRIFQGFAAQTLSLLVSFGDRFLVVGILLRVWGPQTYADWALLFSSAGLLSLGELGLNIYYGNYLQKASADNDPGKFQRMVSVALACSIALGALLGGGVIIGLYLVDLPEFLSISELSKDRALSVFFLLGLATISRVVRGAISQIYRGRQAFPQGIIVNLIFPASFISLIIAAGLMGATPLFMATIYLACDLLAGWGLMLWDLKRRWPDIAFRPKLPVRTELADMAHHVKWLAIIQGAPVAWLQFPVVLLGYLGTTASALVSFLVLRTLVNFTRQFATMLSIASGVEIASVHYAGHSDRVPRQLAAVGKLICVIVVALASGIALYGEPFVAYWTGQSTLFNPIIAASLLAAALIAAPAAPLASFGMFGGVPRPTAIASLVQIGVGLSACGIFASLYGAEGAAVGLMIGEAIGQGIVLPALISRYTDLMYLHYLRQCLVVMAMAAVWCGTVGLILCFAIDPHGLTGLIANGMLWGIFGFTPAAIAVLPPAQRATIARFLGSKAKEATSRLSRQHGSNSS